MKTILPPTYFFGAIILMLGVHFVLPIMTIVPFPWNVFGLLPLVIGLTIATLADKVFHQRGTTIKPFQTSNVLVTDGFYRFSRHPMYLAFTLALFGLAWLLGSASPLAVVVLFAVLMDIIFIRAEERMLADTFGEDWQAYTRRVRRWL